MGYMIQNSNYFRQHPFTLHGDAYDYVSVTLSYNFKMLKILTAGVLGVTGQYSITKDSFDRWYLSAGETGGISLVPGNMCIVAGRIVTGDREHLADTLANFIPGKSCNITLSAGGCIGESQADTPNGPIQAFEIGFGTPQISLSTNWACEIEAVIKQYFS